MIRRYWDTACFLSILNGEPTAAACKRIFDLAVEKKTEIWVTPLVQVEVVAPRASRPPIPEAERELVRQLFAYAPLHWRDVDQDLASLSRTLSVDFGVHPRDSVHVAAAIETGCDLLETFDKKLLGLDGRLPTESFRALLTKNTDRAPLRIAVPDAPAAGDLFAG